VQLDKARIRMIMPMEVRTSQTLYKCFCAGVFELCVGEVQHRQARQTAKRFPERQGATLAEYVVAQQQHRQAHMALAGRDLGQEQVLEQGCYASGPHLVISVVKLSPSHHVIL